MPTESMMMMNNETLAQELLNRLMDMVLFANATSGIGRHQLSDKLFRY